MQMLNLRKWGLAAVCAIGSLSLQAQTPQEDEDIFILDAFIVDGSAQRGYVATTAMSGTRLAQLVRDIPIQINIITEDFMRDTGALTIADALRFQAGIQVQQEDEVVVQQAGEPAASNRGTRYRLRGFVSNTVMRHGFRREGTSDTINVSQVDVVRGPNALLYGIGNFGGVINYVTRVPRDELQTDLRFSVGSWGFYRMVADVTGPITENIAVRVPVMYQDRENFFDHFRETRRGLAPVLTYQMGKNTRLTVEFDYYEVSRTAPENPLGMPFLASADLPFTDPTNYPQEVQQQGFLIRPHPGFRYAGLDTYQDQTDIGILALVNHAFTDNLAINFGAYWTETKNESQSVNLALRDLQPFGSGRESALVRAQHGWAFNPLHERYDDWRAEGGYGLRYTWGKSRETRERRQARAELLFQPDWFDLDHSIMAGTTYENFIWTTAAFGLKDTDPQNPDFPLGLSPSDNTGFPDALPRFRSIFNLDPIRFEPSPTEAFFQRADAVRPFDSEAIGAYLIHQTSFFENRLRTIAGLRYDRFQISSQNQRFSTNDFSADGTPLPLDQLTPEQRALIGRLKPDVVRTPAKNEINYSLGLSWSPTQNVSLFALTASALDPEAVGRLRTPDGFIADPVSGQSYEIGGKVDLFDDRISGSFSVYSVRREGVPVSGGLLDPFGLLAGFREDPRWENEGREGGDRKLRNDRSEGLDLEMFIINIIPNLETVLSFSYNNYSIQDEIYVIPVGRGDDGSFQFRNITTQEAIDEGILPSIGWDDSRLNNDTARYTFRIWNKYTFREGFLENFDIGLGVRWTDRREVQFSFDDNPSFKIIPDRLAVDLAFGYLIPIGSNELNVRVNISNLLNDDKVYGYQQTVPRNWRVSLSYRF
jgi:iron complex outermembrane receptor protein